MNKALREQLEHHRVEINRLCQQYGVLRLDLFGSATLDRFDQRHSDLDFPVTFGEGCTSIDNYLPLAEGPGSAVPGFGATRFRVNQPLTETSSAPQPT
jgi:predicted nucleotidyltransferase